MKEIKDIAMWEETDSELAKYTIQKQNYEMEEAQELINYLDREKLKLQQRIDKAIKKYEKCKEEDYCTLALDMYDILRGNNENE